MKNIVDKDICERVKNILENKFNINVVNFDANENLLERKFGLRARDLIYLLFEVEKEFQIEVSEEDIDNIEFNTLGNIISIVNKKLELSRRKSI